MAEPADDKSNQHPHAVDPTIQLDRTGGSAAGSQTTPRRSPPCEAENAIANDPQHAGSQAPDQRDVPTIASAVADKHTPDKLANAATELDLRPPTDGQTLALTSEAGEGLRNSSAASASGTRFRVLRAWREGGLGKVSIARDEELHREVALKEIKPQHAASKNNQERFLIEGEITGSLEHPGIVPVYGMGRYSDGRPYYAMRFVRGEGFDEAIAQFHAADANPQRSVGERSVAFRELLGRFIAVCNALAYAHSRGVVHRDLKPGNILLAKYGETLVVDWGLAKVVGQNELAAVASSESVLELQSGASTATRLGAVVGTPAYMSPEQAEGQLDLIGPASDIYSLGATLYCILTSQAPFVAPRLQEVLFKVKHGEFPRPRELKPQLPVALEAICLKAMAFRKDDRYATASALAADLEHWLADEPVTAHPETPRERALRWIRRHRSFALATGIALLVISTVSIVAAVLVNRQRVIANEARANADIAFREARDAVDDFFTTVSEDTLFNQPGMLGLRNDLLKKTLAYYQNFLSQRAGDPSVQEEYGMTLFRTGRILDELHAPEDAVPKLEQAIAIQQKLLAETPHDTNRIKALAETENALGRSLHRSQHLDEAFSAFETGRKLRLQLVEMQPKNSDYVRALANSTMNLGMVEEDRGNFDLAQKQLLEAQKLRDAQLANGEENPKLERDLAIGEYNLANLASDRKQYAEAAKYYAAAIDQLQKLLAQSPHDLALQFLVSTCYRISGDVLATLSPEDSARMYEEARKRLTELADRNPEVNEYQKALAGVLMSIGFRQPPAAAVASFQQASEILERLVAQHPHDANFRRDLAANLRELGCKQIAVGQRETGIKSLKRSVEMLEQLVKEFPEDQSYDQELKFSREALDSALAKPEEPETV